MCVCLYRSCVRWWGVLGVGTRLQSNEDGERLVLLQRGAHQQKLRSSVCGASKVSVAVCSHGCNSLGGFYFNEPAYCALPSTLISRARFPQQALHEAVVLGRRYTAEEAKESRIVEEVCPVSKLEERAVAAANKLAGKEGLNRGTLSAIKQDLYRDTLASLNEPMRFYSRL